MKHLPLALRAAFLGTALLATAGLGAVRSGPVAATLRAADGRDAVLSGLSVRTTTYDCRPSGTT